MHRTQASPLLLAVVLVAQQLTCPSAALGAAAPLKVALVRWHELPTSPQQQVATAASALRAAGYPAVPQLSRPPFQRAADVLLSEQQRGVSAFSLATPIPIGVAGPSLLLDATAATSSSSHVRKLHQQQQQQTSSLQPLGGFEGTSSSTPAGTAGLAVGPQHLLHAAGGQVTLYNLTTSSSNSGAAEVLQRSKQSVSLAALFSAVAAGCDGVYDPLAVYDAAAHRFLLSATCGGQGLVLLAVSATSDAAGAWFVSALVADGVGTALACSSPVRESALVDFTQLSYNADGVFVAYKSMCPSSATHNGVGLMALPKWALYRGLPTYQYPIYTGSELSAALVVEGSQHQPAAAGAGAAAADSGCAQLVPVVPQSPADVGLGTAYFVCELVGAATPKSAGHSVAVFALIDTATLWQYGGPATNTSAPLLVGHTVQLEAPLPPVTGLPLRQPAGAQPLQLGTRPRGFWNGAAVVSGGQLYLATSTLAADKSSPSYMRRPAIVWAQLSVNPTSQGADSCQQSRTGVASRQAWDWATDYSKQWGAAPSTPSPAASAQGSGDRVVRAANLLPLIGAAQFAAVGLTQLGANPCTCYSCFWGGQYNRYGGYNGGALAGTGSGFAAGGYFFNQGAMSRCQSFCTRCWYYGYPGNGFANVGDDRGFMDLQGASPFAANLQGANPVDGPSLSINTAATAEATSLFGACSSRSGSLQAQVVRQGVVTQGGAHPLGLVFPALVVGHSGELLLTFSYSGPNDVAAGVPAYLGAGAAVVAQGADTTSNVVVLQPGRGTVRPAALAGGAGVPPSGGWAELSAAAVHSWSGTAFTLTHVAAAAAADAASVGSWIASWRL